MAAAAFRCGRALARLAAVLWALSILTSAPALAADRGWSPNDDDSLLFDVRVDRWRLGDGVRGYQTPDGICVDLADMVMALDLPLRVDKRAGRVSGWLFEEERGFTLDRGSGRVEIAGHGEPIADADLIDTPEGWCVRVDRLSTWWGLGMRVDLGNALLFIESDRKLPFQLSEERKERAARIRPAKSFNLADLPQVPTPYAAWRQPSVDATASLISRHGGSASRIEARFELFASGEIAGASVDARLTSDAHAGPESLRTRIYRADPGGGLLGPLDATFVGAGDLALQPTPLAVQSASGRGLFVTNRPLDRADTFDRTNFVGELPAGWDAELYRNEQLIAFAGDRGDGRYEFLDVPLLYGGNSFEIVLYGPQGQTRRETRQFNVGIDSIPARQTWYWAGAVEADRNLVDFGRLIDSPTAGWRGGVGVERGLDSRTSAGVSFSSIRAFGERHQFGEALVRRALGGALLQLSGAVDERGHWAAEGRMLAQLGSIGLSGEAFHAPRRFVSDRFDGTVRSLARLGIDATVALGMARLPLRIEAASIDRQNGDRRIELGGRLSFNIGSIQLGGEYDGLLQRRSDGTRDARHMLGLRASGRIGRVRVRADARYRLGGGAGLEQATLTADWRAGMRSDWRIEVGHDATSGRTRARGGLIRRFDRFALGMQAEFASDGSIGAGLDLAFSLGPDPRGRGIRLTRESQAGSGTLLARVFQDSNGDGIRQAGEPLLQGVGITTGLRGQGDATDERGETIVSGLAAFRPVLVGMDASSLTDPGLAPAGPGRVVVPRPGIATIVDLPVSAAGQIEAVIARSGGSALQGVDVELIDAKGNVIQTARTDFDGYLLFEAVPIGRYGLRLTALSAGAVDAHPALDARPEIRADALFVRLGTIVVRDRVRMVDAAK